MAMARAAVQCVKNANRFEIVPEIHPQFGFLRFANAPSQCALELLEKRFWTMRQVDRMTVKGQRWPGGWPIAIAPSAFKIAPAPSPASLQRQFIKLPKTRGKPCRSGWKK